MIRRDVKNFSWAPIFMAFAFFCISVVNTWTPFYEWHDQQRSAQVFFLFLASGMAIFYRHAVMSRLGVFLTLGVFFLGIISSVFSSLPAWALREWSVFSGCVLLALVVAGFCRGYKIAYVLLYAMAAVASVLAAQFFMSYLMAFVTGIRMLHMDVLFTGFSNPRFLGQFQMLAMPILAFLASRYFEGRRVFLLVFFIVLAMTWCISYSLGGRGLWLALFFSHILLMLAAGKFWRIIFIQLLASVVGALLFSMMFFLIPAWLGIEPVLYDGLRTGLSAREVLWQAAWAMSLSNFWLGAGPMHFAALHNDIAAHPHQIILQLMAEWGVPATILVIILIYRGLLSGTRFLRQPEGSELDASLWVAIVGALILAQVDGVFVMPYTQTWLAILVGIAISRWSTEPTYVPGWHVSRVMLALPSAVLLAAILIFDVPQLPFVQQHYLQEHSTGWKPRFWQQGWIPMPMSW